MAIGPLVHRAHKLLVYAFGIFLYLIGVDKVLHTNVIAPWETFIGPVAHTLIPFSPLTVVFVLGCIEVAIGTLFLFTPWVRLASTVLIITILLVAIDLMVLGYFILVLRDAMLIVSLVVLVLLAPPRVQSKQ